ncbi:hypothetical protein J5Y04_30935 [Kitasatospora sp. RG8]|uniref:hypothetical protein n=1 Tax=Kitasatospora sp. RG8 TaxID=2820815 RepID=UPI001AE017B7|nr:hypothetical protein [Kitasatospora sp. RG8]MBP0453924.1 hypothetical protein [Kitasatospora sp. RG8]
MSFSPGVNAVSEPMLFGAPACAVCGKEMEPSGTGRPRKYCSKKCSSKADRVREKEKQTRALAAAAETPRGETGLPDGLADDPAAAELLTLGEELLRHDRLLLLQLERAARDNDPALARQGVSDVLHAADVVMQRHRELVERLLAEHPTQAPAAGQPAPEPAETPRGETRPGFGSTPGAAVAVPAAAPVPRPSAVTPGPASRPADQFPRGETTTGQGAAYAAEQAPPAAVAPRGETTPAADIPEFAPAAPRGETPAPPGGAGPRDQAGPAAEGGRLRDLVDRSLAQQTTPAPEPAEQKPPAGPADREDRTVSVPRDPLLRGLPSSMDVHIPLDPQVFGYDWALAGWTVQPDVMLVLGEGHQVGWVERGLDGGAGWVAVYEGYFLGDPVTQRAALHDTPEMATRIIHQAHVHGL